MSSKRRQRLFVCIAIIAFLFASVIASYAESINYVYDDLNRLIKVVYGNRGFIVYTYDEVGNRLTEALNGPDTTAPTTTASPTGGSFVYVTSVILSCSDGSGAGCDKIYYTTDGSTPTTASTVYSTPIILSATTTLKFFARDLAENSESVITQTYTITLMPPIVTTGAATTVSGCSAILNGTVNPNSVSTTYHFEWGLTTSYGNTNSAQSAGSAIGGVPVSFNLTDLAPNTTYHYRLVATNSAGTTNGTDMTFETKMPIVDFNNDGKTDLLWSNKTTGNVAVWYMDGVTLVGSTVVYQGVPLDWRLAGTGDFNNDGKTDLLWSNKTTGNVAVWYMDGVTLIGSTVVYQGVSLDCELAGTGDFNGDGKPDLLWFNKNNGNVSVWFMDGVTLISSTVIYQGVSLDCELAGIGDFNGDGKPDLLWFNKNNGNVSVWYMDGITLIGSTVVYQGASLDWRLAGTGDLNGDGKPDLLWSNKNNGNVAVWYMDGVTLIDSIVFYQGVSLDWELVAL